MAYTPYEWTVNSYLNPTRMNAIEQGIAEASQAAESASGEFHTIEELIGTQSIAGIGDGTLTGATWKINNDLSDLKNTVTTLNSNSVKKSAIKTVTINGTTDANSILCITTINSAYSSNKIIPIYLSIADSQTTAEVLIPYSISNGLIFILFTNTVLASKVYPNKPVSIKMSYIDKDEL